MPDQDPPSTGMLSVADNRLCTGVVNGLRINLKANSSKQYACRIELFEENRDRDRGPSFALFDEAARVTRQVVARSVQDSKPGFEPHQRPMVKMTQSSRLDLYQVGVVER